MPYFQRPRHSSKTFIHMHLHITAATDFESRLASKSYATHSTHVNSLLLFYLKLIFTLLFKFIEVTFTQLCITTLISLFIIHCHCTFILIHLYIAIFILMQNLLFSSKVTISPNLAAAKNYCQVCGMVVHTQLCSYIICKEFVKKVFERLMKINHKDSQLYLSQNQRLALLILLET